MFLNIFLAYAMGKIRGDAKQDTCIFADEMQIVRKLWKGLQQ